MSKEWLPSLAWQLERAAAALRLGKELKARTELATGIGNLLTAAAHGDDEAFQWLSMLRTTIDDAQPTDVLDLRTIEDQE
jgi:hypothetical protein